jgi:response regulator of citrate/malate metabolism
LSDDIDGIALAGVIQEECDVPVVLLTSIPKKNIFERAYRWGISKFVMKPFKFADL